MKSKEGIPEKMDSGCMARMLELWTPGRLDSGQLDSGGLNSGRLDVWTLDAWTMDVWTLGL